MTTHEPAFTLHDGCEQVDAGGDGGAVGGTVGELGGGSGVGGAVGDPDGGGAGVGTTPVAPLGHSFHPFALVAESVSQVMFVVGVMRQGPVEPEYSSPAPSTFNMSYATSVTKSTA